MEFRKTDNHQGKNNPKQTPREISKEITKGIRKPQFIGPKSIEVIKQEITSCIQNYQETFNSAQLNEWQNKLQTLIHELEKFKK